MQKYRIMKKKSLLRVILVDILLCGIIDGCKMIHDIFDFRDDLFKF